MMRQAVYVALLSTKRVSFACGIIVGKLEGKRPLEKLGIHGRVVL
jgi:hypothetical protein